MYKKISETRKDYIANIRCDILEEYRGYGYGYESLKKYFRMLHKYKWAEMKEAFILISVVRSYLLNLVHSLKDWISMIYYRKRQRNMKEAIWI